MREIIFRGKRFKDGEWVEGVYVCDPQEKNEHQIYVTHTHPCGCCLIPYSVIPESVGQYTGLTDKNGKMIFEGDICRHRSNYSGNTVISVVTYKDGHFLALVDENSGFELSEKLEVIGNIHDNGELLKEG